LGVGKVHAVFASKNVELIGPERVVNKEWMAHLAAVFHDHGLGVALEIVTELVVGGEEEPCLAPRLSR
jgi:hypothetical protein